MNCNNCRPNDTGVTLCPFHSLAPRILEMHLAALARDIEDTRRALADTRVTESQHPRKN